MPYLHDCKSTPFCWNSRGKVGGSTYNRCLPELLFPFWLVIERLGGGEEVSMYARLDVQSRKSSLNAAQMLRRISPRLLQFSLSFSKKEKRERKNDLSPKSRQSPRYVAHAHRLHQLVWWRQSRWRFHVRWSLLNDDYKYYDDDDNKIHYNYDRPLPVKGKADNDEFVAQRYKDTER